MKEKIKAETVAGQFRQGDVIIERIESVPSGAEKQRPSSSIVLAKGEATGHHHCLETEGAEPADWWKHGEDHYVQTRCPAKVRHEEHAAIELAPAAYRVRRQREYSPGEVRRVAD